MKKVEKRLEKIEEGVVKVMAAFTLLYGVGLVVIAMLLFSSTTPENAEKVLFRFVLIVAPITAVFMWWLGGQYDRQWKFHFAKEFPMIHLDALENTVKQLDAQQGSSYLFRKIAKALVVSLQDEQEGDTFLRDKFGTSVKETYRFFRKSSQ